ncbi:MAG: PHP domain-containing protein, partial [Clostridiales bacterium]
MANKAGGVGMGGFDMHIHSTASDGQWTPQQIIDFAADSCLDGIAMTDHDTVAGLGEACLLAADRDLPFIPGIEFSAEWHERDVHILGYWLSYEETWFLDKLEELQEARRQRCLGMADRLKALGMEIDGEAIIEQAGNSVGRPHVARALVEKGYARTMKEAFQRWLARGMAAYIPRHKFCPFEAVDIIRQVGGVAVLAHPGVGIPDNLLEKLAIYGLGGVEVYHPEHDRRAEQKYLNFARYFRLAALGGSDFHGSTERGIG